VVEFVGYVYLSGRVYIIFFIDFENYHQEKKKGCGDGMYMVANSGI